MELIKCQPPHRFPRNHSSSAVNMQTKPSKAQIKPQKTSLPSQQSTTIASPTFTLFGQLPIELQIQIWDHACSVPGEFLSQILRPYVSGCREGAWCYFSRLIFNLTRIAAISSHIDDMNLFRDICLARKPLLETCRMSRLIALQSWKEDVNRRNVRAGGVKEFLRLSGGPRAQSDSIVQGLDRRIRYKPFCSLVAYMG